MLKVEAGFSIGEGFFSSEPIPTEIDFNGHVATFFLRTPSEEFREAMRLRLIEIKEQMSKLGESDTTALATLIAKTETIQKDALAHYVTGWDDLEDNAGNAIPYTPANRDKLAVVEVTYKVINELVATLITAKHEATEKN